MTQCLHGISQLEAPGFNLEMTWEALILCLISNEIRVAVMQSSSLLGPGYNEHL